MKDLLIDCLQSSIDVEFTRHFIDRVNDARNKKDITPAELTRLFKQTYNKHGKKIPQSNSDAEAVLKDMQTDINMPFVLKYDRRTQEFDLIAKQLCVKKVSKLQVMYCLYKRNNMKRNFMGFDGFTWFQV